MSATISPMMITAPGFCTFAHMSMNGMPAKSPSSTGMNTHSAGWRPPSSMVANWMTK